jgi:hypothetical protein
MRKLRQYFRCSQSITCRLIPLHQSYHLEYMQERFVTIFADMQLVPSLLFNSDFSAPILMKMANHYTL